MAYDIQEKISTKLNNETKEIEVLIKYIFENKIIKIKRTNYPPIHDIADLPTEDAKAMAKLFWTDEVKQAYIQKLENPKDA